MGLTHSTVDSFPLFVWLVSSSVLQGTSDAVLFFLHPGTYLPQV